MTVTNPQPQTTSHKVGLYSCVYLVIAISSGFLNGGIYGQGCGNECSADETCVCQCSCNQAMHDCADAYNQGFNESGIYTIKPLNWPGSPFEVYCNMTDGGGWTVIQRRVNGSVNFYRDWNSYKNGFGSPDHELWLGNDKLYHLTNPNNYQLRVDVVNRDGIPLYAKYDLFRLSDENDNYTLTEVGTYSGNIVGDSYDFFGWHKDKQFSTYDRDNDPWDEYDCAERHMSGWWHGKGHVGVFDPYACPRALCNNWPTEDNCGWCSYININGVYKGAYGTSPHWKNLDGYVCNITYTEMKVKPV